MGTSMPDWKKEKKKKMMNKTAHVFLQMFLSSK
jgi:hypothetical protein